VDTLTTLPVTEWAQAIEETFEHYGKPPMNADMQSLLLFDRAQGQFVMLHHGCYRGEYDNRVVAHLELRGDQILVHDEDAGMNFIAPNLIQQGVPRDKITVVAHPDWHIEKA